MVGFGNRRDKAEHQRRDFQHQKRRILCIGRKRKESQGNNSQGEEGKRDFPRSDAFIVTSMGTMLRIVHRRRQARKSLQLQQVKH